MCSIDFAHEVGDIKKKLEKAGHDVSIPFTVADILAGKLTVEDIKKMREDGTFSDRTKKLDLIRWNWDRMQDCDAILVVNLEKKGINNYIGANTFLEIGFAHVLKRKILFWVGMPDMPYHKDEIEAMSPVILNQNLDLIQ